MFESIVTDLLNRFLGQFIVNLDTSQIGLGIWGGDYHFENLQIREDALRKLPTPVLVKYGILGKLILRIPWKNLYEEPVELVVEDVLILALSKTSFAYDPVADAASERQAKQALLTTYNKQKAKVEHEAEEREKRKAAAKKRSGPAPKPNPDSFVEKLKLRIMKNIQVSIKNIHIRYEDTTTVKHCPFSCGFFLGELSFKTMGEDYSKITKATPEKTEVIKVVSIERIAVYWDPEGTRIFAELTDEETWHAFQQLPHILKDHQYIIKPIFIRAEIHADQVVDPCYAKPRVNMEVEVSEIAVQISTSQFSQLILLNENFGRIFTSLPFRKFRPLEPITQEPREWWVYAFKCVCTYEEFEDRKRWEWRYIKEHRRKLREYIQLYKLSLSSKVEKEHLLAMEDKLNFFNITFARNIVEREAKIKAREAATKGWRSWLTKQKVVDPQLLSLDPEETKKLYKSIGYQEGEKPVNLSDFPINYIDQVIKLKLKRISVAVSNNDLVINTRFLHIQISGIFATVLMRPAANSLRLLFGVKSFTIDGFSKSSKKTRMLDICQVTATRNEHFISLEFETHPRGKVCDQCVEIRIQPLAIILDMATVALLQNFATAPDEWRRIAAVIPRPKKLVRKPLPDEPKKNTLESLVATVVHHTVTDVNILISPSYIIIPENGLYTGHEAALVVDLGEISVLSVISEAAAEKMVSLATLRVESAEYLSKSLEKLDANPRPNAEQAEAYEEIAEEGSQLYDNFNIAIRRVQILVAKAGQSWRAARKQEKSPLQLLRPLTLEVNVSKCMVEEPLLPKLKVEGSLNGILLQVCDVKIVELMALGQSFAEPRHVADLKRRMQNKVKNRQLKFREREKATPPSTQRVKKIDVRSKTRVRRIEQKKSLEAALYSVIPPPPPPKVPLPPLKPKKEPVIEEDPVPKPQYTEILLKFTIHKLGVTVQKFQEFKVIDVCDFQLIGTQVKMKARTWDTKIKAVIQSFAISNLLTLDDKGGPTKLVYGGDYDGASNLLLVHLLSVKRESPDFVRIHKRTKDNISVDIGTINIVVHGEAIKQLITFGLTLVPKPKPAPESMDAFNGGENQKAIEPAKNKPPEPPVKKTVEKKPIPQKSLIIDVKLRMTLEKFQVRILDKQSQYGVISIGGFSLGVIKSSTYTNLKVKLQEFGVVDQSPLAVHPIFLEVVGDNLIVLDCTIYEDGTRSQDAGRFHDILVDLKVNKIRINYTCKFVKNLMHYAKRHFTMDKSGDEPKPKPKEAPKEKPKEPPKKQDEEPPEGKRIILDITLNAPIIVVPRDSYSLYCIVLDLGKITVGNRIRNEIDSKDVPYLLDDMNVKLVNIKLRTGVFEQNDEDGSVKLLPGTPADKITSAITTSVRIKKKTYRKSDVRLTIQCHIEVIEMLLNPLNIDMILAAAFRNLLATLKVEEYPPINEGKFQSQPEHLALKSEKKVPKKEIAKRPSQIPFESSESVQVTGPRKPSQIPNEKGKPTNLKKKTIANKSLKANDGILADEEELNVWKAHEEAAKEYKDKDTVLHFNLQFDGMNITMSEDPEGKDGFCNLQLTTVMLDVKNYDDKTVIINVGITELIVDDIRGLEENKISRLMRNRLNGDQIVTVQRYQFPDFTSVTHVVVSGLCLIVNVEFFMNLGAFVGKCMAHFDDHFTYCYNPKRSSISVEAGKPLEPLEPVPMLATVKLHEPEICVIKNLTSLEVDVIYFTLGVDISVRVNQAHATNIELLVGNMTLFVCPFKNVLTFQPTAVMRRILEPVFIEIKGGKTMTSEDFTCNFSEIRLKVSPVLIVFMGDVFDQKIVKPKAMESNFEDQAQDHSYDKMPWHARKTGQLKVWYLGQAKKKGNSLRLPVTPMKQNFDLRLPKIHAQVEGGKGQHTIPLLLCDIGVNGNAKNWASLLAANFTVTMGVAYFNEDKSVWEPLIEPVEDSPLYHASSYHPWTLELKVRKNRKVLNVDKSNMPPLMYVSVLSENFFMLTMTSATLKVLTGIGSTIEVETALQKLPSRSMSQFSSIGRPGERDDASVVIKNDLGFDVTVEVDDTLYIVTHQDQSMRTSKVATRDSLYLNYVGAEEPNLWKELANQLKFLELQTHITVSASLEEVTVIAVNKTGAFIHTIAVDGHMIFFVVSIDSKAGVRKVSLHSHIQVQNFMHVSVKIYLPTSDGHESDEDSEESLLLTTLEHNETYHLPLDAIDKKRIELQPADNDNVDRCVLSWESALSGGNEVIKCVPFLDRQDTPPFYINAHFVEQELDNTGGYVFLDLAMSLNLYPCLTFQNFLPFSISYGLSAVVALRDEINFRQIPPGVTDEVYEARIGSGILYCVINNYLGQKWKTDMSLKTKVDNAWTFYSQNPQSKTTITMYSHVDNTLNGTIKISLYSPYWLINHTGGVLCYKSKASKDKNTAEASVNDGDVLLFSFDPNVKEQLLQVKITKALFSKGFNITAIGNDGSVSSPSGTTKSNYMIGTQIRMASFRLSRMVTFTPYFYFFNKTKTNIEFCENLKVVQTWLEVRRMEKKAFWPGDSDHILIRVANDMNQFQSIPMNFKKLESGVLVTVGHTAFYFEVAMTEWSITVLIRDYFEGASVLLVVNITSRDAFEYWQDGSMDRTFVNPGQAVHVFWSNANHTREMYYSVVGGIKRKLNLLSEHGGKLDGTKITYEILLDGLQRVMVLMDPNSRDQLTKKSPFLQPDMRLEVSFKGFSISLVDTLNMREVCHVGIKDSGAMWESEVKENRWKPLTIAHSAALESAFEENPNTTEVEVGHEVYNLKAMNIHMHKTKIRRIYNPGFGVLMVVDNKYKSVNIKIQHLQIDNQTCGAVNQVVIGPHNGTRSQALKAGMTPKPFFEVSLMQHNNANLRFMHCKYLKVLIQEFDIKIDFGFVMDLVKVFAGLTKSSSAEADWKKFLEDLKKTEDQNTGQMAPNPNKYNYYDLIHLSPIKLHISLSLVNDDLSASSGSSDSGGSLAGVPVYAILTLVKSFAATIGEFDDVVFKLSYFEREFQFFDNGGFGKAAGIHYVGQVLKQIYVVFLGLDVLGNPFGLMRGFADGLTDMFYEPYQGAIQGPDEFLQGLGVGALSLIENTVGGTAGAVSKMTSSVGKGLATLSMDEDYKRERLKNKNKPPKDASESFARGGKSLVGGFVHGLTGIVVLPVRGAKQHGATGFIKGVGKGLIGVVIRPVSGVVDATSCTFDGIQRATGGTVESARIRPARYIDQSNGVISPYCLRKALGAHMLYEMDNGALYDLNYIMHFQVRYINMMSFLIITDRLVLLGHSGEVLGQWKSIVRLERSSLTVKRLSAVEIDMRAGQENPNLWKTISGDNVPSKKDKKSTRSRPGSRSSRKGDHSQGSKSKRKKKSLAADGMAVVRIKIKFLNREDADTAIQEMSYEMVEVD